MTRRFFRCPSCGHRLRFGASVCGNCYLPTPLYNRRLAFWLAALLIPIVGLVVAVN
ncbi:hypothetical protein [Marinovum sp.]|uniref:hypothetical protein n=1 Tax=Marinovum sp. TaxID=2024839 RepID=UPI003A902AAF